ncbi:MAG: glutathione S-transferase family protein [Myxococcales bacterium]|nr:glutathione S-transferase family protein [Myxococcales bacterium]
MTARPTLHHIPVCPFSQRLEILLALKGLSDKLQFHVVDITKPRDPELLRKTRGTTSLPVLELEDGRILKESLVILRYIEDRFPTPAVARKDPYERAVENMLIAKEGPFTAAGYIMVMNQDREKRQARVDKLTALYADLDAFLRQHSPEGTFLFDRMGLAEAVFTPMFMRFWFLDYYEDFRIPETPEFSRVRAWHDACIAHPAAQQVSYDEIIKLYYDYAIGAGNGALATDRNVSSFVFEPAWQDRPMPPRDKWAGTATDAELGLV